MNEQEDKLHDLIVRLLPEGKSKDFFKGFQEGAKTIALLEATLQPELIEMAKEMLNGRCECLIPFSKSESENA